ncbi:MAG TPA: hypothetical protein VMS17_07695 [Gemmataceae bacterium]|nr:hypothetical protein [Gemmataceae bacterium]
MSHESNPFDFSRSYSETFPRPPEAMSPERALPALIADLKSPDRWVRDEATQALKRCARAQADSFRPGRFMTGLKNTVLVILSLVLGLFFILLVLARLLSLLL